MLWNSKAGHGQRGVNSRSFKRGWTEKGCLRMWHLNKDFKEVREKNHVKLQGELQRQRKEAGLKI